MILAIAFFSIIDCLLHFCSEKSQTPEIKEVVVTKEFQNTDFSLVVVNSKNSCLEYMIDLPHFSRIHK